MFIFSSQEVLKETHYFGEFFKNIFQQKFLALRNIKYYTLKFFSLRQLSLYKESSRNGIFQMKCKLIISKNPKKQSVPNKKPAPCVYLLAKQNLTSIFKFCHCLNLQAELNYDSAISCKIHSFFSCSAFFCEKF